MLPLMAMLMVSIAWGREMMTLLVALPVFRRVTHGPRVVVLLYMVRVRVRSSSPTALKPPPIDINATHPVASLKP